jgi:hypothetical protein
MTFLAFLERPRLASTAFYFLEASNQCGAGSPVSQVSLSAFLAMPQVIPDGAGGTSDIEQGRNSFQLRTTCLVKEIAQTYQPHSFPDKVRRQAWHGARQTCDLPDSIPVRCCAGWRESRRSRRYSELQPGRITRNSVLSQNRSVPAVGVVTATGVEGSMNGVGASGSTAASGA